MRPKGNVTLRQLVLLLAIRRERLTIPEVEEALSIGYGSAAKVVHGLRKEGFLRVVGERPRSGKTPLCRIYAPSARAQSDGLTIPLDTEIVWPQPKPERRQRDRSSNLPVFDRGLGPAHLPRRTRKRSQSGSGQIAGYITVGRGSRWIRTGGPW